MRELNVVCLRELLPPSIAGDPNVIAAAEAIDGQLRQAVDSIPGVSILPRIREITDSTLIDLLAWQFHVDFYDPDLPLDIRRSLVEKSLDWHTRKGTPAVVEEIVSTVFSDGQVMEWWEYGAPAYHFKVTTQLPFPDAATLQKLVDAIWSVKNTRSWCDFIQAIHTVECPIYMAGTGSFHYESEVPLPEFPMPGLHATPVSVYGCVHLHYEHQIGGVDNL